MSIMSQLRRKQANFMFPKKRTKLTNEEFAVRLLRHSRNHILRCDICFHSQDVHDDSFSNDDCLENGCVCRHYKLDWYSYRIFSYLISCAKDGLHPSKETIKGFFILGEGM